MAAAEEARARFLELVPEGFEERDAGDRLELAAYVDPAGEERLRHALGATSSTPVADDWHERWRSFHRGLRVGGLWIGPPWEQPPLRTIAILVDPGRAFGTGAHPTTRLCLQLLSAVEPGSFLDLGCGSGVLAIAAVKLGFEPVVALDNDEAAIQATCMNASANGVLVDVRFADVLADPLPPADAAVVNVSLSLVDAIGARLTVERLITSGYLVAERPRSAGYRHQRRLELDGWAADLFERHRK